MTDRIREWALSLPDVTEDMPFGEHLLVFRIGGKIFLLLSLLGRECWFNVKCDPSRAEELRAHYRAVTPGYHMNKVHWNTIRYDSDMREPLLREQIRHSYELVRGGLPRALRERLAPFEWEESTPERRV